MRVERSPKTSRSKKSAAEKIAAWQGSILSGRGTEAGEARSRIALTRFRSQSEPSYSVFRYGLFSL